MGEPLVALSTIDVAYGSVGLAFVALVVAVSAGMGLGRQRRRLGRLLQGSRENLESALVDAQHAAALAQQKAQDLEQRVHALEQELPYAISQIGIVRFNPFDDTGADLSFAVALLNQKTNGVVLTGLWGRDEVRVYAKQIANGESTYTLSQEERQALELARRQKHR